MMAPFLKWAGGKRWLVATDRLKIPQSFNRYIEPFLGGGAVFFAVRPENSVLSDLNPELINLYIMMRDSPRELTLEMEKHHSLHSSEHYYEIRNKKPICSLERAARTLYLNRTCWNGLYRVNLKGEFNVPIGTKSAVLMPDDDFFALSNVLNSATIICCDFEKSINEAQEGDFLFIDPPYTVKHNMNGFLKYNENIFGWSDQIRLHRAVERAVERGAAVVVTNADHESVRNLYSGFEYQKLTRSSVLAASSARRGQTTEAMFFANI